MRMFLALEVPLDIKKRFLEIQNEISKIPGKFTFPSLDHQHITLFFFGDLSQEKQVELEKGLRSFSYPTFEINLLGLDKFPQDGTYIKVIWAGISDNVLPLYTTLAKHLNLPTSKFVPHLTLARVKWIKDPQPLLDLIEKYKDTSFGRFSVDKITLFASTLTPKGPIYKQITSIKLNFK